MHQKHKMVGMLAATTGLRTGSYSRLTLGSDMCLTDESMNESIKERLKEGIMREHQTQQTMNECRSMMRPEASASRSFPGCSLVRHRSTSFGYQACPPFCVACLAFDNLFDATIMRQAHNATKAQNRHES